MLFWSSSNILWLYDCVRLTQTFTKTFTKKHTFDSALNCIKQIIFPCTSRGGYITRKKILFAPVVRTNIFPKDSFNRRVLLGWGLNMVQILKRAPTVTFWLKKKKMRKEKQNKIKKQASKQKQVKHFFLFKPSTVVGSFLFRMRMCYCFIRLYFFKFRTWQSVIWL